MTIKQRTYISNLKSLCHLVQSTDSFKTQDIKPKKKKKKKLAKISQNKSFELQWTALREGTHGIWKFPSVCVSRKNKCVELQWTACVSRS